MSAKETTKMTAAEAVDFLNVWGEAELKKAVADRSDPARTETTDFSKEWRFMDIPDCPEPDTVVGDGFGGALPMRKLTLVKGDRITLGDVEWEVTFGGGMNKARLRQVNIAVRRGANAQ